MSKPMCVASPSVAGSSYRVLDGDVQYPVLQVFLEPYLDRLRALRYEVVPEGLLFGVDE